MLKKLLMLPLLLLTLTLSSCELKKDSTITVTGNRFFHTGWATEPLSNTTESLLDIDWDITRAVILVNDKLIEVDVEDWKPCGSSDIEIKSKKGKVYLTHLNNVVLVGE